MQEVLIPMVRDRVAFSLRKYVRAPQLESKIDKYIVRTPLGEDAGVLGAIALAKEAADRKRT